MTLIVEDGTGLNNAESYISVDFFKTYHKDRGTVFDLSTGEIEAKLRLATEFIDLRWGRAFPGNPLNEDQALCIPTDYFDPPIPVALKRACAEIAKFSTEGDLFINQSNASAGIRKTREEVGPIRTETVYFQPGDGGSLKAYPLIRKAEDLMKTITFGAGNRVYR